MNTYAFEHSPRPIDQDKGVLRWSWSITSVTTRYPKSGVMELTRMSSTSSGRNCPACSVAPTCLPRRRTVHSFDLAWGAS